MFLAELEVTSSLGRGSEDARPARDDRVGAAAGRPTSPPLAAPMTGLAPQLSAAAAPAAGEPAFSGRLQLLKGRGRSAIGDEAPRVAAAPGGARGRPTAVSPLPAPQLRSPPTFRGGAPRGAQSHSPPASTPRKPAKAGDPAAAASALLALTSPAASADTSAGYSASLGRAQAFPRGGLLQADGLLPAAESPLPPPPPQATPSHAGARGGASAGPRARRSASPPATAASASRAAAVSAAASSAGAAAEPFPLLAAAASLLPGSRGGAGGRTPRAGPPTPSAGSPRAAGGPGTLLRSPLPPWNATKHYGSGVAGGGGGGGGAQRHSRSPPPPALTVGGARPHALGAAAAAGTSPDPAAVAHVTAAALEAADAAVAAAGASSPARRELLRSLPAPGASLSVGGGAGDLLGAVVGLSQAQLESWQAALAAAVEGLRADVASARASLAAASRELTPSVLAAELSVDGPGVAEAAGAGGVGSAPHLEAAALAAAAEVELLCGGPEAEADGAPEGLRLRRLEGRTPATPAASALRTPAAAAALCRPPPTAVDSSSSTALARVGTWAAVDAIGARHAAIAAEFSRGTATLRSSLRSSVAHLRLLAPTLARLVEVRVVGRVGRPPPLTPCCPPCPTPCRRAEPSRSAARRPSQSTRLVWPRSAVSASPSQVQRRGWRGRRPSSLQRRRACGASRSTRRLPRTVLG